MAKKNKGYIHQDRVSEWLSGLKYSDLKRAAIMRGFPFNMVGSVGVQVLESYVYKNFDKKLNPNLLMNFDKWLDRTLMDEGAIDAPIHIDLKLGFYAIDEDGNEKRRRRDLNLMGAVKSEEEVATFRPKKGSKKTLVFDLMERGYETREIIEEVQEVYPDTSEGTIKVWCSQARKKERAKEKLGL